MVVVGEVLAIAVGLAVVNVPLATPHAAAVWICGVVGLNFLALAVVWKEPIFNEPVARGASSALIHVDSQRDHRFGTAVGQSCQPGSFS